MIPVAICIFALVFVFQFKIRIPNQYPDLYTVTENTDPVVNYFKGRSYLAMNNPENALPFLIKAARYAPDVADYHFWLGVAYWGLSEFEKERQSYQRAIDFDQSHIPAHLYLGHHYLDKGAWGKALEQYDRVLNTDPDNPAALYNRGLSLMQMGRLQEEKKAWVAYLSRFETGGEARSAVAHLNTLGDFSYRTFLFGRRNVVLKSISFKQKDEKPDSESLISLDKVGSILENNRTIVLHIVVHAKDNARLAEHRSKNIKKYLLAHFSTIDPLRLKVSWFNVPETVLLDGKTYTLSTSVRFITETFYAA
ncbi:MAG: tetratricopeptide repeat protein [Bacteroidales bacterium]|nr:tetratricopeptide repeat protein [Bacteroidales bacterium]